VKIPNEKLIEDLKRVAKTLDKKPTQAEYSKFGKYSTTTFTNRKPWNKWLMEVFGEVNKKTTKENIRKISKEDLITNLLNIYDKIGKVPQKSDLKFGKYGVSGYNRVFNNFCGALLATGFKPYQQRGLSNEDLKNDLRRVYELLGHTPSLEEFTEYTQSVSGATIHSRFGSWTKALLAADIPIAKAQKVSKQDVIEALEKWYNQNNCDTRCLEYWTIRKAHDRRDFPYSCETISAKFNKISWEDIMKTIDSNYQTIDQFVKRGFFKGKDKNIYLSSVERHSANILYALKKENKIKDYEYEAKVCENRSWTCDFKIILNNESVLWLEIDGMRNNRKVPYGSGENEKIEHYKNTSMDYEILSYNNKSFKKSIHRMVNKRGF
jgi:hypothetical protein